MIVQASINIDLDTLSDDVDAETHVIRSDELRRITYESVLPRLLELLDRHEVKATFFVIGRDIEPNAACLSRIAAAGHELANHTMNHPKQLVNLPANEIAREIAECGSRLEALSGTPTVGFRAPGYTISPLVIEELRKAGYRYDTSLNASLAYSMTKRLFLALELQDKQYVTCQPVRDHFGPRNPFRVARSHVARRDDAETFVEIPVSVIPHVHYPFVTSVLLPWGPAPTLWALDRLVMRRRFVNCGLHVNEFTDPADVAHFARGFFYTRRLMRTPLPDRMAYFDALFAAIRARCQLVLLRDVVA